MELQQKTAVPMFTDVNRDEFLQRIYPQRRPAVLRGVPLGPCLDKWTVEYLRERDAEVKVHVSAVPQMDFLHKNFVYKTLPFNEFVKRASEKQHSDFFLCEDESYYLRSLGGDFRKEPADLSKQFPDLAEDFHIPQFFEPDQFFSSIFRISSCGLQLWTHYDVMDNLLAQVTGRKRVVLYSPQDALHLYLAALWFHNTLALEFGVGVNVFWRHLPVNSYDRKDPYGNKDPVAAARALQALDKALKTLDELPADYQDFYGRRMIQLIQKRTLCSANRQDCDTTLPSSQFTKLQT
ncbi:tRNA wybutosine-synthesizing protein 5 isoform X2 [Betta splendens]|uniref:tRNA wybutosine-synthesizing protein 5 isoform X2 n=1 Tax=Betta splendens TaxID=158456 RepID=A0A6P7LE12_BETSP|nr:tRNA wybutosine-synthesizing protein 5 isoform X2 [Betta splendens]